jgi:hypothetical protein
VKFGFRYTANEDWGRLQQPLPSRHPPEGDSGSSLRRSHSWLLAPFADQIFGTTISRRPARRRAAPARPGAGELAGVAPHPSRPNVRHPGDLPGRLAGPSPAGGRADGASRRDRSRRGARHRTGDRLRPPSASPESSHSDAFPRPGPSRSGPTAGEIVRFVVQSSLGTGIVSFRSALGTHGLPVRSRTRCRSATSSRRRRPSKASRRSPLLHG